MNDKRARLLLGVTAVFIGVFFLIYFILLYSLAIIELATDGFMRPFTFLAFVVAVIFTMIFGINRYVVKKDNG